MRRITLVILSIFFVTTLIAQKHCISRPSHIDTELFPGAIGELKGQDYFVIYSDSIEFDGLKYKINESTTTPFDNKDDLLRIFSCQYDFLSASENITGDHVSYQMESNIPRVGENFQFIHFNDCGVKTQFVYVEDGLYGFSNRPFFVGNDVNVLRQTGEEEVTVEFTYNTDTSALVYYIEEPEFEIITDQVLIRDAYNELNEVPNEFEERYALYYNEISDCENAVFDTIYEEILVNEGGLRFEITPALLGTYSEQRAAQTPYQGQGFYERVVQDSLIIELASSYVELGGFEVNSGCSELDFFDCINFDFETVPSKDSIVYNVYEKCADGFESAGKFCYSNNGAVPWVFTTREYERLEVPASAATIVLPNEYKVVALTRIVNKDELGSDCVETVIDSIPFQKLVKPATIEDSFVPAVYGTVQYKRYEDGGIIEVVNGEKDSHAQISTIQSSSYKIEKSTSSILMEDKSCYIEAIKLRLIEIEYLAEDDIENLDAFQLAVLNFQIDNNLPLGVINFFLVDILEVNFGY